MPELRWDEEGRLFLGGLFAGGIGSFGEGSYHGSIVDPYETEWCAVVVDDVPTEQEARAAVEAAVRKALGWVEGE